MGDLNPEPVRKQTVLPILFDARRNVWTLQAERLYRREQVMVKEIDHYLLLEVQQQKEPTAGQPPD